LQTTEPYQPGVITEELPHALSRWNWGAFLLNWIWGIGNRCHFALLTFVPFFGLIVPFVLGAKGNLWAWKAGDWRSLQDFQRAQRRWTRWALIAYAGAALMAVGFFFVITAQLRRSPAFELAHAELVRSESVMERLGTPLQAGRVTGSTQISGSGSGGAQLTFDVSGPRGQGKAYVEADKHAGEWQLRELSLVLDGGERVDVRGPAAGSSIHPSTQVAPAPAPAPPPPAAEIPHLPVMRVHLRSEQVNVRGAVARDAVESALNAQRGTLERCLERSLGAAQLTLKLTVAVGGEVRRASVERARGVDAEARECVLQAARAFDMPGPSRGLAVVKQTIAIAP